MKGSIEKINKSTYRLRYPIGILSNGNPNRLSKNVKAKTDKEAYMELAKWNIEIEEKGFTELDNITFENFYKEFWLKQASLNLEIRTYEEYKRVIQIRFLKKLGGYRFSEIKPYQIKDLLVKMKRMDTKKDLPLARESKKRALSALSNVFIVARDEYRIIDNNPCNDVRLPKEKNVKKNVQEPYTVKEIELLFSKLKDAPIRTQAIVMTALTTGARQGEIAALEEKHFDYAKKEITFNQRIVTRITGERVRLDGLKATNSKTLVVPEQYLQVMEIFVDELREQRKKLNINDKDVKHKYIFGTPDGDSVNPGSLNRHWRRFAEKNELRFIRFHDFRHTSATYLISKNMPVKNVQERLGHKSYTTTIDIYSHALREVDQESSDQFDTFFG